MSGSRSITLTLSVKDAEKVRAQLEQMGKDGEAALERLDKAAQRAASKSGLGGVSGAADQAGASMGDLRQKVQNFGYQLQDFTVQVQGGTSSLVALSQQGSQFLGMFGPAGAVAGAALAIGTVAVGFLTAASNAEQAKAKGQDALDAMTRSAGQTAIALRQINDLFLTAGERAARLANLQQGELRRQTTERLGQVTSGSTELRRRLSEEEGFLRDVRAPTGGTLYRAEDNEARDIETRAVLNIRNLRSELAAAEREADSLREGLSRLDRAGRVGVEEYGPTSRDPFGVTALRSSFDEKFKIQEEYRDQVTQINAMLRNGYISEAQASEMRTSALSKQNDELKRLDTSAKDAAKSARERAAADKAALGEVTALIREQNQQYDQEQDRQNRIFDNSQKMIDGYKETLSFMDQESGLLSRNADERGRALAILKEQQALNREGVKDEEQIAERLKLVSEIYEKNLDFTQRKNSFDELARVGEQAFDRIGSAITEAFVQGKGRAVGFGNVTKAVLSEIAQAALRMAIVNPALNAMFGGTRGSIAGLMGSTALSGGGGNLAITDGSGGIVGYVQQGAQAYSAYSKLSGINPGNYINGTTAFNTGYGWLDGALNTTAVSWGGNAAAAGQLGAFADTGMTLGNSVSAPASGASALSYGGAAMGVAGIAGGLYGAYTGVQRGGVGGYTQAAGGAATAGLSAAAMYGATIPVYGWIAAAALLVLGALLPGQKPSDRTGTATYYTNDPANPSVGGLNGDRFSQENRDQALSIGGQLLAVAQKVADVTSVPDNRVETSYRVAVGARDGLNVFFGEDKLHGEMNEEGVTAVTRAFVQRILLTAAEQTTDANVRSVITRSGVDDPDKTLANLSWYNNDYKSMIAESVTPTAAFVQQVKALVAPIDEAKTKAQELGIAVNDLNAVSERAVQTLIDQRTATLDAITTSDSQRQALASGTSSLVLQIENFSKAAQAEVRALDDQLRDLDIQPEARGTFTADRWRTLDAEYQALTRQRDMASMASSNSLWDRFQAASGQSETLEGALWDQERRANAERLSAASDGMTDMVLLEKTLAEERAAIIRRFNEEAATLENQRREQAQESVVGTLGGITDFIRSMQTDGSSLLSPQAKLDLLGRDFNDVAARASAGDYDAISEFTSVASSYRSAARDYYGSSAGFGMVQGQIAAAAESIGNLSADTLTTSSMDSIMRNSTENLGNRIVAKLDDLQNENKLLRLQLEGMATR